MIKVYTKVHLLKALQKAKLPYSYKSLLKYEKLGIIPRKSSIDVVGNNTGRFYTQEEITEIVSNAKQSFKNEA